VTDALRSAVAEFSRDGARRFAGWDPAVFHNLLKEPVRALHEALGSEPSGEEVLSAYLQLLQEGVGTGLVRRAAAGPDGWTGFLERMLVERVPALLPAVTASRRVSMLVKLWNIGEGLSREPAWLDRYAAARCDGLDNLASVEGFLTRALDPVLAPAPAATWTGPFAVTVLDLRTVHDEFLPGEVKPAGPCVLGVADRRTQQWAGVLLRPGGKSELLGITGRIGEYADGRPLPPVAFGDGKATVAGREVPVPTLRRCHRFAAVAAGFVAAAAVDSQRLWILESP
jgi:hypothetical protein